MSSVLCHPPVKGGSEPKASGGLGFKRLKNSRANAFKTIPDLLIGESHHAQAQLPLGPQSIASFCRIREVTVSVDLDDQPMRRTIEIHHIEAERFLPGELFWQRPQKLIPKLVFCRRAFSTQATRVRLQRQSVRDNATLSHSS
jgi:hypothetical protein